MSNLPSRRRPRAQLIAGAAVVLLLCGCRRQARLPTGTPIVLISIDTLRADHLPAYGYRGVETPAIDALRRDSILFAHAYSHTPLTFPSHASLLTGLLPAQTGVRDNVGYQLDAARIRRHELTYLPLLLKEHGYATGAAVSAFVLQGKTGLATGFDSYDDAIEFRSGTGLGGLQRPGSETLVAAQRWLSTVTAQPFFLFFHLYEPHTPYEPPEPFASRYPLKYDGEIATADAIVGQLLDELRRAGNYDRSLILLVSDHGEGLGDHGEDEHGVLLYTEAIHVPLLLKLPAAAQAGATVEAPAQLTDVVPTLLELLRLPVPAQLTGTSLLHLDKERPAAREIYSETFYPRLHFGWSDLASLVGARYQYIEGPAPELFDLENDPRERVNLLTSERRIVAAMRTALRPYERRLQPPAAIDAATQKAMESLGYLGVTGATTAGPLPDPKLHLASLTDLKRGFTAMRRRDDREAAADFRAVIAANPAMVDAWEFLGRALNRLGDSEGAIGAYQQALKLSRGSGVVALALASLYFELGRDDEAATHARMALAAEPAAARQLLAQVALHRGDLPLAEREARQATSDASLRLPALITLAEVLHGEHRYEEALATSREAEALDAQRTVKDLSLVEGLSLIEGKIQADLGDATAAESAFRREIERFPEDERAYANLAILEALTGRSEAATATLQQMVAAHPSARAYAEAVRTYRVLRDEQGATALLTFALRRYPDSAVLRSLARSSDGSRRVGG